jgi:DNA end-binding protein Ku
MARAMWSGEIAFGLVTIPAKLYTATRDLTPSFNQLHTECGSRISMARRCPKCARDVEWGEIGKGYEVAKGEYALFTKEELAKLEGDDSGGGIEIVEFIDPKAVDLAYIGKSYWVGPGGKSARGYDLLRQALEHTQKVALAKVKIRSRTQLGLLRPRGKLFALEMMRYADELVPADDIAVPDGARVATERELQLALSLVDQLAGDFDPAKHPDEYRAAFEAALDEKTSTGQITKEEGEPVAQVGGKVIDLAELLARSLGAAGPKSARPDLKKAAPAKEQEERAKEDRGEKDAAKPAPKRKKKASGE